MKLELILNKTNPDPDQTKWFTIHLTINNKRLTYGRYFYLFNSRLGVILHYD